MAGKKGGTILRAREFSAIAFGYHGHGFIMALRAYFDASGKDADQIITVGGYLTSDSICEDIERDWLAATGGKVFHLQEFGRPTCKLGSSNWTLPTRQAFLKRLASIVNRRDVGIISVTVEISAYRAFLKTASYAEIQGPPISGAAQACTHFTEVALLQNGLSSESLAYVFEKGDREHELAKTLNDYEKRNPLVGPRSHNFLPKSTTLLQPADLIAGVVSATLKRAHSALHCLDNGTKSRTMLDTFERYYSNDGLTRAVVTGHDKTGCFVANPKLFEALDAASLRVAKKDPKTVTKRLRQLGRKRVIMNP